MITPGIITYSQIANFERTQPFSVESWLYHPTVSSSATNGNIACRLDATIPEHRGWMWYISSSRRLGFVLASNETTGNFLHVRTAVNIFAFLSWTHIVVTYTGNSLASGVKCYVNNSLKVLSIVSNTLTGTILNKSPFNSGGYSLMNGYAKANFDELTIYDRVLSAAEVSQRYNGGAGTENLFGPAYLQYHLNESSGSVVADSSGNSRHAITRNAPTWMAGKLNNCLSFNGVNQDLIGVE